MLNSIATTPPADKGRFNSLREIITAAYALATSPDADIFDVVEMIEVAASNDGALPFDRASRRDAWNLVSNRAQEAFRAGRGDEEAAERAEMRAYRASRVLFDRLSVDATMGDFVSALLRREPAIGEEYARSLANDSVAAWSAEPVAQRAFTSSDNPFAETRTLPPPRAVARWRKACAMHSGPDGGPGGLRLAAVKGEPVETPAPAHLKGKAPDLLALEGWAMDSGATDLGTAIRRERLGMTKTTGVGGLAFVDFDPAHHSPPPSWLAKGLLPRTGIGLLYGESGAGKSFAAIHTALSIAWGLPLFGSRTKRGAVLYIAAEGGKSVLRRFKAANDAIGGAIAAANLTRSIGQAPLHRAPIRVVHEAPDLSRDGSADPLIRTIRSAVEEFERAGERLALVIVDTWHAAMGGGDENSAADAGHALKPLIAESEAGDFLTLIVHHPGKDSERGARGSNALPAAADAIIAITVPGHTGAVAKPSTAVRRAVVTKMRDGEAGGGFDYRLNIVVIGTDEDGEPVTTCTVTPCDTPTLDVEGLAPLDREFLAAVTAAIENGSDRAQANEVRLRFYAGRPDAKTDARRKAWSRALRSALDARRVEMDEHDTWIWLRAAAE